MLPERLRATLAAAFASASGSLLPEAVSAAAGGGGTAAAAATGGLAACVGFAATAGAIAPAAPADACCPPVGMAERPACADSIPSNACTGVRRHTGVAELLHAHRRVEVDSTPHLLLDTLVRAPATTPSRPTLHAPVGPQGACKHSMRAAASTWLSACVFGCSANAAVVVRGPQPASQRSKLPPGLLTAPGACLHVSGRLTIARL
jgi:hypothetical protein